MKPFIHPRILDILTLLIGGWLEEVEDVFSYCGDTKFFQCIQYRTIFGFVILKKLGNDKEIWDGPANFIEESRSLFGIFCAGGQEMCNIVEDVAFITHGGGSNSNFM